mmetsp:Transcript_10525/g.16800  ORF Transcript_10525/g.16800 Transcript_10525/m.16800 type:complete len:86 (+) Transcript_10525:570-827(+)
MEIDDIFLFLLPIIIFIKYNCPKYWYSSPHKTVLLYAVENVPMDWLLNVLPRGGRFFRRPCLCPNGGRIDLSSPQTHSWDLHQSL